MKTTRRLASTAIGIVLTPFIAGGATMAAQPASLWANQFGTSQQEWVTGLAAAPDGGFYLSGYTAGALFGSNAGETDGYLLKVSTSGQTLWSKQFGSALIDRTAGVAVDAAGNPYVVGTTAGVLGPATFDPENHHGDDVYVRKFDAGGSVMWTRQVGGNSQAITSGIAVSPTGLIVDSGTTTLGTAGWNNGGTNNAILRGYSQTGSLLWERITGGAGSERAVGVA